jgi:hypothetical protein
MTTVHVRRKNGSTMRSTPGWANVASMKSRFETPAQAVEVENSAAGPPRLGSVGVTPDLDGVRITAHGWTHPKVLDRHAIEVLDECIARMV